MLILFFIALHQLENENGNVMIVSKETGAEKINNKDVQNLECANIVQIQGKSQCILTPIQNILFYHEYEGSHDIVVQEVFRS